MRRDWTKDYLETTGPDGKRSYIYIGDRFELTEEGRRSYAMGVTPGLIAILIMLVLMGLGDSAGSRVMYVALPWAASCFAAAMGMFDLVRILMTKRALTKRDYASSALRLKKTLLCLVLICALAFVCDLIYMILNGFPLFDRAGFSALLLNQGVSAFTLFMEKKVVWNQIPSAPQKPPA